MKFRNIKFFVTCHIQAYKNRLLIELIKQQFFKKIRSKIQILIFLEKMKKNDQTSPLLFTPHFDYQLEEDDSYLSTTCISAKMIENAKAMLDLDVRPLDTDKSRVEQIAQCSLQISDEFKRCLPCQFLGKGRFGWVEESLDSKRAIKRPNDNDNAYMHLENEMKALKHVSKHHNKHIIELLDYCTDQKV